MRRLENYSPFPHTFQKSTTKIIHLISHKKASLSLFADHFGLNSFIFGTAASRIAISPPSKRTSELAFQELNHSWTLYPDTRIGVYCQVIGLYRITGVPESVYKYGVGEFNNLANIIEEIINADAYLKDLLQKGAPKFLEYYKTPTDTILRERYAK